MRVPANTQREFVGKGATDQKAKPQTSGEPNRRVATRLRRPTLYPIELMAHIGCHKNAFLHLLTYYNAQFFKSQQFDKSLIAPIFLEFQKLRFVRKQLKIFMSQ